MLNKLALSGADQGLFNRGFKISERGFDLIKLAYLHNVFVQTGLSKPCRPRADTAGCHSSSNFLDTFTGSRMELM